MGSRENQVTKDILTYLRYRGHEVWRNNTGQVRGSRRKAPQVGLPDILGYHKDTGAIIAIEVKEGRGKPTSEQICFLARVKRAGGIACTAWAMPEVATVLNDYETFGFLGMRKVKGPDET